jgi:hypothetical protein
MLRVVKDVGITRSETVDAFWSLCYNRAGSRGNLPIMPGLSDVLVYILGALAVGSAAAFALGSSWNMRRGNQALRWLREALPALGERTTLQWLGTSVVKLTIAKARKPFKDIEILIVMEPRDVPPFWLHGHLNGRRDTLIFRGRLREPPAFELEVLQPTLWTGREALAQLDQSAWKKVALDGGAPATRDTLVAFTNGAQSADRLQSWLARSQQLTVALARLSLRRTGEYQIQWHATLPRPSAVSAADVIGCVQQVATEAIQ